MIMEVSQSPIAYADHKEITQFILIKNVLFLELREISFDNLVLPLDICKLLHEEWQNLREEFSNL